MFKDYLLIVIVFITFTSGYDYTRWDLANFADCIKDYLLIKGGMFRTSSDSVDIVKIVADLIAMNFYEEVKSEEEIINEVNFLIDRLRNLNYISPWDMRLEILRTDTIDALLYYCNREAASRSSDRSIIDSSSGRLLEINDEPEDISAVLNLILVRWLVSPRVLVRTRPGRFHLRKYVNDVLDKLSICLSNYDHEHFRILLRALWIRRAQRYFSGSNIQSYPYSAYFLYIVNDTLVRNINVESYSLASWSFRNAIVPRHFLDMILNTHILTYPDTSANDIYDIYDRYGMGQADYFFESQVDLFYRIVFFFLELKAAGIATDEQDIYADYIPHEVLPATTSMIVASDFGYSSYLIKRRQELMSRINDTSIEIDENFGKSGRVWEENLVWLMINKPSVSGTYSTTPSTSNASSSTSTTDRSMSISIEPYSGKRKADNVFKNKYGKYLPKQSRTTFPGSCCGDVSKGSDEEFTVSCLQQRYNYYVSKPIDMALLACYLLYTTHQQQEMEFRYRYCGYIYDPNGRQMTFSEDVLLEVRKQLREIGKPIYII